MKFDKNDFTWGYEIEWGDIDRRLTIPEHLGQWEYSETDVINKQPEFFNVACDPLGIDPPWGGEVNTKPTNTWQEQVDRIMELKKFFESHGNVPSASFISHGHIHAFVPGLKEDIDALKRLVAYIRDNQALTVQAVGAYEDFADMKKHKGAKMYLKLDGGRQMPEYMTSNIINLATDFDHFINLHRAGKDGVSMGRPFRYAINTYCMKHTGTIEFRCFRDSIDRDEIEAQFRFVEMFIDAALNNGPNVATILRENEFKFAPFVWDPVGWEGYLKTKYDKNRGKKERQFFEVA